MVRKEDILNKIDVFKSLAEKYNLSVVLLYGSVASGRAISESDVDFAIRADKVLDWGTLFSIEEEIKKILRFPKVQVIDMMSVSENFLFEIFQDSISLFLKDQTAFEAYKMYVWKIWVESKWLRDMNYAHLKKSILDIA